MHTRRFPRPFPWAAAVLTLAALAGCARTESPPEPVRAVKVLTVRASGTTLQQDFAGEVCPCVEARLGFRVVGKIIQRQAEVG